MEQCYEIAVNIMKEGDMHLDEEIREITIEPVELPRDVPDDIPQEDPVVLPTETEEPVHATVRHA